MSNCGGDYEIGYGKPPEHTRFQPGQSGNPKGRPKKTKDLEKLFDSELSQTLRITEGGQSRTITKRDAIVKGLVHAALKGDHRAQKLVVGVMQKHHDIDEFELDTAAENILDDFMNQWKQTNKQTNSKGENNGSQNTNN